MERQVDDDHEDDDDDDDVGVQTLSSYLVDEFKKQTGIDLSKDRMALQRLKEASEKAKIELSTTQQTEARLHPSVVASFFVSFFFSYSSPFSSFFIVTNFFFFYRPLLFLVVVVVFVVVCPFAAAGLRKSFRRRFYVCVSVRVRV